MVSVTERVYEGTVFSGAVLFDPVLRISALHAEAGTGKKAGSLAYCSGEFGRINDSDIIPIFGENDGLFP